jgi:hypothetical protein
MKIAPLFRITPGKQAQKYQSRDWYIPVVQALAPFSPGGCRAVIGLVPRASLTGYLFDLICARIDGDYNTEKRICQISVNAGGCSLSKGTPAIHCAVQF